jgi:GntR family transcriptional regulator, transcriptional repressor for pyruvate dehydrogenase complex
LFEIFRARELVEGEIAALVARDANAVLLGELAATLVKMESEIASGLMPVQSDRRFHLSIAEGTDNGPLLRTVAELYDMRNSPLFDRFGQHFESAASWRTAVAEHQAIVDALAAHDPDAARTAMHRHLQRSHDSYAAAWTPGDDSADH